jgi:hypothetical protein
MSLWVSYSLYTCADSVIRSCSCWVSTLKYRIELKWNTGGGGSRSSSSSKFNESVWVLTLRSVVLCCNYRKMVRVWRDECTKYWNSSVSSRDMALLIVWPLEWRPAFDVLVRCIIVINRTNNQNVLWETYNMKLNAVSVETSGRHLQALWIVFRNLFEHFISCNLLMWRNGTVIGSNWVYKHEKTISYNLYCHVSLI